MEKPCGVATNNIRVIYNRKGDLKEDFGVCVKGLQFRIDDQSARLAEWIELLCILGAKKVNKRKQLYGPALKAMAQFMMGMVPGA